MSKRRYVACSLLLLCAIFVIPGCWQLSVHPLYTAEDLVSVDGLEGVWGDPDDPEDETWQFIESDGKSYRLIIREEEQSLLVDPAKDGLFEVHLLRLGGRLYMDVFPEEPEGVNGFYMGHVIPAHSFIMMELEGHVLTLSSLDVEWLKKGIDEGRIDIKHERRDDTIVLTASTGELQEFVVRYADEAFNAEDPVYRLQ